MNQGDQVLLSVREAFQRLDTPLRQMLVALVSSVEASDPYHRGHSARVALISTLIGEELGLPVDRLQTLNLAALLHNVGTIAIPTSLVNKPARLTPGEFEQIKEHPIRGEAILGHIPALHDALPGIRSHHERWSGTGYPDGLSGAKIPLNARIIAVADVYDAMTCPRPHRPAQDEPEVLFHLKAERGRQFDPEAVDAFFRVLERVRRLSVITGDFSTPI